MALSNWGAFAFDENGKPTNARFESERGIVVDIYKNWVRVRIPGIEHDEGEVWNRIYEGRLTVGDVNIVVEKHEQIQNGVMAMVWTGYEHKDNLRAVAMCGVYGYKQGDWVGVEMPTRAMLGAFAKSDYEKDEQLVTPTIDLVIDDLDSEPYYDYNQGDKKIVMENNDLSDDEAAEAVAGRDQSFIEEHLGDDDG